MCNNGLPHNFFVRSPSGSVQPPCEHYTTRLVAKVGRSYVKVSDEGLIMLALRILANRIVLSDPLLDPRTARQYVALRFAGLEHEVFAALFLDSVRRVIACVELFRGSINEAVVSPREVVKQALSHNARGLILAHNHPSGIAVPSEADIGITRRLRQALALVDVQVLDHLVVGDGSVYSMAEHGLI